MMEFNRKRNSSKKQLAKDAVALLRSSESIYWHELEKPESERDTSLMAECLRVMEQSSAQIEKYSAQRKARAGYALKWVAACIAIVFVLTAVSTGVAYALGVNVWEHIFTHTETGIEISGKNDGDLGAESELDFDAIEDRNQEKVDSIDEAKLKLNVKPLNFDLTKHGYMIDNIYITKNDAMLEIFIEFLKSDGYVDVTVQAYNGKSSVAYVTELVGDFSQIYVKEYGDTEIYVANDDRDSYVCFAYGEYVYQLNSNAQSDVLLKYAEEAISAYH